MITLSVTRSRSSISWKHADDDGEVSELPDVSRKIKVVVSDENAGVYQCFAGNNLVQSFKVKLQK